MIIRKATIDHSSFIATYLLLAMEDIVYQFIGEKDYNKAREFLMSFVKRENNQYSYQNCFVAEDAGKIIAAVNLYDGARLNELREPIVQFIKTEFGRDISPEDETQEGEYYIDSFGVDPNQQGKGVGSKILQFLINEYVIHNRQTLGLLVDEGNPSARKLYLKLGFKPIAKKYFLGKGMEHLQISETTDSPVIT